MISDYNGGISIIFLTMSSDTYLVPITNATCVISVPIGIEERPGAGIVDRAHTILEIPFKVALTAFLEC